MTRETAREILREAAEALERDASMPYGPPVSNGETGNLPEGTKRTAGRACVDLAGGDRDKGIALWQQIVHSCYGYMPEAAALTLILAARAKDLVVPDAAPEVS